MTYLFTNNQEIKNDVGNPIPISKNTSANSAANPIHTDAVITGTVTIDRAESPSTVTAFGEQYGISITPVIQLDAIYGITPEVIQTYNNGTGSGAGGTPLSALFTANTGTTAGGYGVVRSKRFIRYRTGQGALCRFTAAFTAGVPNSLQFAGLANQENRIAIGYDGDKFGVVRSTGGKTEIRQLTINSISTGSQTLTITLNGTAFTVTVNTASPQDAAVAIATHVGGYTGWLVDQVDNTIVFMSTTLGPKTGTYSLTGSGTVSGTFAQRQAGIAQTDHWTYQYQWNVDTLGAIDPETGERHTRNPSGMTLDPTKLNVYQINFRWLGAGEIRYALEDQATGNMIFIHKEHYTNQNNVPHVANPSFKITYAAYNITNTSNLTVTGASMMAAIEGTIFQNELNRSTSVSKTSLNSAGTLYHLLTLRNPYVTNGAAGAYNGNYILNAKEIILKDISIGTQGNDPGIVYIFFEPTSFSGTHSYRSQSKDNGMISTVDGTIDETVDTAVCRFITAINGEAQYRLSDFRIAIPSGSYVSIAIKSTSNISRVSAALVFSED
jgi:hypothetical protein